MKKNYYLVQFVAKERIKEEILRVFKNTDNPFGLISLMDELNILKYIFPSVASTKHIDQPVRYHPLDTYHHTIMTLYHIQKINKNYLVRFGMLYHDV
jgi:tRNA nucleotidyltransferase/poly(A) polymerase